MRSLSALLLCASLCGSCTHDPHRPHRDAASVFVSGKAYLCEEKYSYGQFAVGKTVRLVTADGVLAEDVVRLDGTFVLHPLGSYDLAEPIYLVAGDRRTALTNDYASWFQDQITYRATVRFGCELGADGGSREGTNAPLAADAPPPSHAPPPNHAPSPKLLPRR